MPGWSSSVGRVRNQEPLLKFISSLISKNKKFGQLGIIFFFFFKKKKRKKKKKKKKKKGNKML